MNELTMAGLKRMAESHWGKQAKWMAVRVTIPNTEHTEIIVNPEENIAEKIAYYEQAYDENLVHRHVPAIRIVDYAFAPTFAILQTELAIYE